jgi:exopolyphosphatase/guanosine-5'-triphosphate,3'-diphosphate pyrophosphatase
MRVGAIDIGSNSIRLLVADVLPGDGAPLVTVSRAGEPCRLGRGLDSSGLVDIELADRAADVCMGFVERARALGARHLVAGATAALRGAADGPEVARRIGERIGVTVRILTGEEEARLVYTSVVRGLGATAGRNACVVFDLGGGSTEVVSGFGAEPGRWVSLPFGAVSLTERFIRSNPPHDNEMTDLSEAVKSHLMRDCALMPDTPPMFAGVGGTVTVLAALDQGITSYEPSLLEGWTITAERLDRLTSRVAASTEAERAGWPILGKGRSDIIAAGALVIRELAARFRPRGLVCSTQGLRYGLARLAAAEALRRPVDPTSD